MKKVIIYFVIFFTPTLSIGQKTNDTIFKRNTIYAEFRGQAVLYSLSYDRLYHINRKIKTSFTMGLEVIPPGGLDFYLGVPLSYNFLFGKNNHHLELGIGFTVLMDYVGVSETDYLSYFTAKIGYRYQRPKGGIFLRATFTPMVAFVNLYYEHQHKASYSFEYFSDVAQTTYPAYPWGGISIGYTFKK